MPARVTSRRVVRHLAAGAWLLVAGAGTAAAAAVTPEAAIEAAVRIRLGLGPQATVVVSTVSTNVAPDEGLEARPDVTARLGQRARFLLSVGGARRGLAVATVTVRAPHVRAARSIARDEAIDDAALVLSDEALPASLPIAPLPGMDEVRGLVARRPIAAGEPVTRTALRVPPVVKSGDTVDATVRIGRVTVTGSGVASGSGHVGDVIRLRQPHSSRLLNARIVGPGAVEIVE